MDRPDDRVAPDLQRDKSGNYLKANKRKSVSLETYKRTSTILTTLIWLVFIVVVGYGLFTLFQMFITN